MSETSIDRSRLAHGIDLFNQAHFYDAHEALEDVWRPLLRGSPARLHMQGLVQLAVAFHHESRKNLVGARSVLDRGVRNLKGAEHSFPQLDLERLRGQLVDWQRHLAGQSPDKPALPCIMRRKRAHPSPAKISKK